MPTFSVIAFESCTVYDSSSGLKDFMVLKKRTDEEFLQFLSRSVYLSFYIIIQCVELIQVQQRHTLQSHMFMGSSERFQSSHRDATSFRTSSRSSLWPINRMMSNLQASRTEAVRDVHKAFKERLHYMHPLIYIL